VGVPKISGGGLESTRKEGNERTYLSGRRDRQVNETVNMIPGELEKV
jgi:hypothetical protein